MGEAKRRGTFEDRQKAAIERDKKLLAARREILARRPSPKHTMLMAMAAGLIAGVAEKPKDESV